MGIKVLFLKRVWFAQPDINTDMTIIFAWNDLGYGRACVYIRPYKTRCTLKTIPFIL